MATRTLGTTSATTPRQGPRTRRRAAAALAAVATVSVTGLTGLTGLTASSALALPAATSREAALVAPAEVGGIPAGVATPRLSWGSCGADLPQFQCAVAAVPTDYDRPDSATTDIALIRLPASQPSRRLGTLFTNPGGPGGSGVEFVTLAQAFYTPEVRARYDILGFDPRGVARSDPATCFRTAEQEASSTLFALPYPLTRAEERRVIRESGVLARQCLSTSPVRFRHASTANVARDMELLRRAVGDPKLAYAGYSYGTYLGATYARLFPDKVGRFVLDATVDPVAWSGTGRGDASPSTPLGIRIRQGIGATETFGEFTRLCRAAGPERCSLAALGNPATVVPRILERVERTPVTLETPIGPFVVDQQVAVALSFQALYDTTSWTALADFYTALAQGLPAGEVAEAISRTNTTYGAQVRGERRGEDYPSIGGAFASLCVDSRPTGRLDAYPEIADDYDRVFPYFGRYRMWVGAPCEKWTVRDTDSFKGPWGQTTDAKILVIGTRFDPATPYRQTEPYAARFPAADVLTVDGWGHTALARSTCADAKVTRYLLTGRTGGDSVCRQDVVPFTPAPLTESSTRQSVPPWLLGL